MIHNESDAVKEWVLKQLYAAHESGIREALHAVHRYCMNNDPETLIQEIELALSDNPDQSRLR